MKHTSFFYKKKQKTTKKDQGRKHYSCTIYGTTFITNNISRKGNWGHKNFLKGTLMNIYRSVNNRIASINQLIHMKTNDAANKEKIISLLLSRRRKKVITLQDELGGI